jgi:hypothetical protein
VSTQPQLFYEDVFEVLRAAVHAAGGTKAVAARLWPNKPVVEAQRELLDSLNRERPRKLDLDDVLAILKFAREAGFHAAKHWLDNELGYQPTQPADPKVERDRLAEELARAAESFKALQRAAERLVAEGLRAVK